MRCIAIDQTASGWISTTLPWKSMNGVPEGKSSLLGEKEITPPAWKSR